MCDTSPALLQAFYRDLPKIELHAHLNGSLSNRTFRALQMLKSDETADGDTDAFLEQFTIRNGESRTLSECFQVFRVAHSLVDCPAAVRLATACTIVEFCEDGCAYLELRSTPRANSKMTKLDYIRAIIEGIKDAKESIESTAITTKLIVSLDRCTPIEQASDNISAALEMARQYPDYVCGVELSGDPNRGRFSDFVPLLNMAKQAGLKVTLHLAEVPNETEISEMIRWHPDRVGHAVYIHPLTGGTQTLWQQFVDAKIPTEICLTSNVKCRSVDDYTRHHLKYLWDVGHPVSLATDDKGVFSTMLSEEYRLGAEILCLTQGQIVCLAESVIDHIFAGDADKARLRNTFKSFKAVHKIKD